ncbi:hypothetical protein PINS_up005260 [Pythium insidiosum]|nr:hypothetical protein PINS_up005260 [Pythium insidiosum]
MAPAPTAPTAAVIITPERRLRRAFRRHADLLVRCQWAASFIVLFHAVTFVSWPSPYLPGLGLLTGAVGILAGRQPVSMLKITCVVLFAVLLVLVMGGLWSAFAVAVSTISANDSDFLSTGVFVLLGTGIHARALRIAADVVRTSGVGEALKQVASETLSTTFPRLRVRRLSDRRSSRRRATLEDHVERGQRRGEEEGRGDGTGNEPNADWQLMIENGSLATTQRPPRTRDERA